MKGLARSLSRGPALRQPITKQVFKIRALALTVDGATGIGFGTVVLGDLPAGNILLLGAVGYVAFTGPTSADLGDTWSGDYSVGSTPAGDATLTGADVDVLPSTAVGPAVAEVSPRTRSANATQVMLDNTDGSLELNLNLLVDDADISADGIVMTCEGELYLAYIVLGDD